MDALDNDLKEKLSNILEVCLNHLVATGKVSEEQVKHRVRIRWDRAFVLSYRGHAAATTHDDQGRAVLIVKNPAASCEALRSKALKI